MQGGDEADEEYAMGLLSFIHDTSASKIISFN